MGEALDCPFCGSAGELRPGEMKPTLEESMVAENNARCSKATCLARFVVCTLSEWNSRVKEKRILELEAENKQLKERIEVIRSNEEIQNDTNAKLFHQKLIEEKHLPDKEKG